MAETKHYRFASRSAFRAAAAAAGWVGGLDGDLMPPPGGAFDEIGPLFAPTTVDEGNRPVQGEVIDPRWHVNVLWGDVAPHEAFAAARVTPEAPARVFAVPPPPPPVVLQPPRVVAAWKGREVLKRRGLLDDAQAAAEAVGGMALLAWNEAAEWELDSVLLAGMASALSLSRGAVEAMFVETLSIQG